MKGDLFFDTKGNLQCHYCHELEKKRGTVHGCPFCSRMRWIDALKPDDPKRDKQE